MKNTNTEDAIVDQIVLVGNVQASGQFGFEVGIANAVWRNDGVCSVSVGVGAVDLRTSQQGTDTRRFEAAR